MCSKIQTIADVVLLHSPEAVNAPMVYEVWEDGEITITKGGELYGHRQLHLVAAGVVECALPFDSLPVKNSKHSRIIVESNGHAERARKLILCASWHGHQEVDNKPAHK